MLFQIIESSILRDITYLIRFCCIPIFIYFTFKLSKKIREEKFSLSSLGFTILFITFIIYLITMFIGSFYVPEGMRRTLQLQVDYVMAFGMYVFIMFTEMELNSYKTDENHRKVNFPLTIISLLLVILFLPLFIIDNLYVIILLALLFFPFTITAFKYMNRFKKLELVRKDRPVPIILIGFILIYLSNLILNPIFYEIFGSMVLHIISGTFTIFAGLMMCRAWNRLPHLAELNWMNKLERLLLIHIGDYVLLFQYSFQVNNNNNVKFNQIKDVAGGAIGGVDLILQEILESESHIKEIDYGDKKVLFNQCNNTLCVLITNGSSLEFLHRLQMFHLSFENNFVEALKFWNKVDSFKKADILVREYFS